LVNYEDYTEMHCQQNIKKRIWYVTTGFLNMIPPVRNMYSTCRRYSENYN